MSTPALQYVEANGLRFAYYEEGTGPLVLLLHGFPDTPHTWDHVRPALAGAGYRAVTPFMRGYAPTAIPEREDYGSETLGRDVLALITALGEEQAIVVGHDWGAAAAYAAASLEPARVRMLITVGIPHPAAVRPTPRLLWTVRHFFDLRRVGRADDILADGLRHIDELVVRWSPAWKVPADETAAVKRAFRVPGSLDAALGYYRAMRPRLPAFTSRLIEMPAVAFAGSDDIVSPDIYERARRCYASRYEVVTIPGGHFMHREHPERFTRELLRVIAGA